MKILYTNFHRDDGGGHTTYVVSLVQALSASHQIVVAAPRASRLYKSVASMPGVRVRPSEFKGGLLSSVLRSRQFRAFLHQEKFDIIHVNGSADHRFCMLALFGFGRSRPAVIYTQHNDRPAHSVGAVLRARLATDHAICVSENSRTKIGGSAFGSCTLHTIRNGVDLQKFCPPTQTQVLAARDRWIPQRLTGRLVVGSNAGTASYKNWLDMVEGVSLLPIALRNQVVIMIAGVLPNDAQRRRTEELGMINQVVFSGLLGDVRSFLAALDVGFVLSSEIETISFACREMMATGLPVIVTDTGGLTENVQAGLDGWVVPTRAPRSIAMVLTGILAQRNAVIAMGEAARTKAVREFSLDGFVTATQAVYDESQVARQQRSLGL